MTGRARSLLAGLVMLVFLTGFIFILPLEAQAGPVVEGLPILSQEWTSDPEKFSFAILGDRRGGSSEEWPVFDRAIEEINLLDPDFVIMVGDQVEGGIESTDELAEQWKEFFDHTSKLRAPLLLIPGNHDIYSLGSYNWWKENLGKTYYSFLYKGCHFLVLNITEIQGLDRSVEVDGFGKAQVEWALETLSQHADARHTFVFVHVPVWNNNEAEASGQPSSWARIEQALQGRPHTVLAGHIHRTTFERRGDGRYLVVGATKGPVVDRPNTNPQNGGFPHFAWATVDGDDVTYAVIEPGNAWPEDVAPAELMRAMRSILRFEPGMPEGLGTDRGRAYFTSILQNPMPNPVTMTVSFPGLEESGWQRGDTQPLSVTVGPDVTETFTWTLVVPEHVVPVPRIQHIVEHEGEVVARSSQNFPLFPDSSLRYPSEWQVIGPYDGQPMETTMPPNPRESMAWIFERQGPEDGYQGGKKFETNGNQLEWHAQEATAQDGPGFVNVGARFDMPFDDYAYAAVSVHSPEAKRVYARFRVDDYGIIYVNGQMIEPGLMRTRRDARWISLDLNEGWNTVVVKNAAITGGWTFWLGFADPGETLRFAADPSED